MTKEQLDGIVERQINEYKIIDEDWFSYNAVRRHDLCFEDLFVRAWDVFQSDIGICGCGRPYDTFKEIMGFLEFCDWHGDYGYTEEQMDARHEFFEQPYAQFMAYILDSKGYVEHGSSINGCFITEKGKDLLAMLQEEFSREDGVVSEVFGECF